MGLGGKTPAHLYPGVRLNSASASTSGFYVQFFNGLIIILALLGHRWNQKRYR